MSRFSDAVKDAVIDAVVAGVAPDPIAHLRLNLADFADFLANEKANSSANGQDACAAAQASASAAYAKSVVSEADVASLDAAHAAVGGLSADAVFARGAIASVRGAVLQRLAAAREARTDGSGNNADWAQGFVTPEAYRYHQAQQKRA